MKNVLFLRNLCVLLSLCFLGCFKKKAIPPPKYEIPTMNHDLGYIPFDAKIDHPSYIICDSTNISSGRNRLKYIGGSSKLREDITSRYLFDQEYETFNGYIVIRFLVNCEGKSGRYRAQSLNLDFSPLKAPSGLTDHLTELIKSLNNWTKSPGNGRKAEYTKYINIKISNGKIQHVLL